MNDVVLPAGPYRGKTLAEVYQQDAAYLRRIAAQPGSDNLQRFVHQQVRDYLQAQGEPLPPPAAPPYHANPETAGQAIFSQQVEQYLLRVELVDGPGLRLVLAEAEGFALEYLLSLPHALALAADLADGRVDFELYEYEGEQAEEGEYISRTLVLRDRGDRIKYPVVLELRGGPGRLDSRDNIRPEQGDTLTVALQRLEASRLGHAMQAHLLAALTALHLATKEAAGP